MPVDSLRTAALEGRSLSGHWIIDSHAHLGPWFNFYTPGASSETYLDNYVRLMARLGIQVTCVTGTPALGPQTHAGNALVAEAVARYPQRFVAYCTVNPHRSQETTAELEHWRMPLVKFHPFTHNYPLDGPGYEPALNFAERHRAVVLIHVWQGDYNCEPERLGRLAEKYPAIPFIAGHSGGTERGFRQCIELARQLPNIYLDPTGSQVYAGSVEALAAGPGAERVLLGTDMGFFDPRPQLGRIIFARLPEVERYKILGENMRRLLLATSLLPQPMRRLLETN